MYRVCLLVLWLTCVTDGSGDGLSDFQRQKLTIFFHTIDRNNDSVLEEEDYHQTAGSYYNVCTWTLDENDVADRQATTVTKAWWAFPFDKEGKGISVTFDEYLAVMSSRVKDPKYQNKLKKVFEYYFQLTDVDGDNLVSLVEFTNVLHGVRGIDSSTTKRYFDRIDTNGDNVLQVEEYVAAYADFFSGDDESKPSKWILGPLY